MGIPREIDNIDIAHELAKASETDLGLAYSLICDTWDAADMSGGGYTSRIEWEKALKAAIWAYTQNPLEYRFNPKADVEY